MILSPFFIKNIISSNPYSNMFQHYVILQILNDGLLSSTVFLHGGAPPNRVNGLHIWQQLVWLEAPVL
jgi:hypothetical protein